MTKATTLQAGIDIHATGVWGVARQGSTTPIPETVEDTGHGARAAMTRTHNLVWSKQVERGNCLIRYVGQIVEGNLEQPRVAVGVTGARYEQAVLGQASMTPQRPLEVLSTEPGDVAERTVEALELALHAAGFDITDSSLKACLQTALDSMAD